MALQEGTGSEAIWSLENVHLVSVGGAALHTLTATDGDGTLAPMTGLLVSSTSRIVADIQVSSYPH